MITHDELVAKHKILQIPKVNLLEVKEPFHPFEGFGLECGKGWYDLLDNLCTQIEAELIKDNNDKEEYPFRIDQIKEKFGGLRFYVGSATDRIYDFIREAENKSYNTCELCGDKGRTYAIRGWVTALCKKCSEKALDKWKDEVLQSIKESKQTIHVFSIKKTTTEEEDREFDECRYWIKISKETLVDIDEMKKRDEVTE